MNTKVCIKLPYFKGVYHTRMIETFANANASMVHSMDSMTPPSSINKPKKNRAFCVGPSETETETERQRWRDRDGEPVEK